MDKQKLIIDTDPGHDDALAILLIEKSQLFDVCAVTTVAGNSNLQDVTNNARYVLDLAGSASPLYSGASVPLKRDLIKANVHGHGGLAGIDISKSVELTGDAVDRIISIIKNNPGQITLLAIGPLTNIALAFQKDPSIISMVKEIVMMGGAIVVPGNKNRVAEFNVFVDPEAADIVFRSPIKKTLIPLDVCSNVAYSLEDFRRLEDSPIYEPVMKMMEKYIEGIFSYEWTSGALMYDPLAAYYLVRPHAFTLLPMDIKIEINSELTRGMTVADKREWGDKQYNVFVAQSVNKELFTNDFFEILNK